MRKLKYGDKKVLLLYSTVSLISAVVFGYMTYMLRGLTDLGYAKDIDGMLAYAQTILALIVVGFAITIVDKYTRAAYIKYSVLKLKHAYIDSLMNQDITQLQKEYTPQYRSHLTQDIDRYETKFFALILDCISMVMQVIVSLVLLMAVDKWIALIALVLMMGFAYITSKSGKPIQKGESKKSESLSKYSAFLEESLEGFEVIKSHQLEASRKALFSERARQVQYDNYQLDIKTTHMDTLNTSIQMLVMFASIVGGLLLARSTGTTLGSVIVIISAFSNVMWPMQQIVPTITQMVGIQDVLRTFDETLVRPEFNRPNSVSAFENVVFDDCELGYTDVILDDVSLTVNKNEKVLIVGPSGAGKSTILKTLRQSILPLSGDVTLNGVDIHSIQALDYYRLFATIDQVGFIFNGTIRENVTLHQEVSEEALVGALQAVNLDDVDLDMMLINNGANLSGGQRARLLSARALCLDASLIICDEIFAALDADVARQMEYDLLKLNKAIVNVSHIYFEDNLHMYDAIYKVNNGMVARVENTQHLVDDLLEATV